MKPLVFKDTDPRAFMVLATMIKSGIGIPTEANLARRQELDDLKIEAGLQRLAAAQAKRERKAALKAKQQKK